MRRWLLASAVLGAMLAAFPVPAAPESEPDPEPVTVLRPVLTSPLEAQRAPEPQTSTAIRIATPTATRAEPETTTGIRTATPAVTRAEPETATRLRIRTPALAEPSTAPEAEQPTALRPATRTLTEATTPAEPEPSTSRLRLPAELPSSAEAAALEAQRRRTDLRATAPTTPERTATSEPARTTEPGIATPTFPASPAITTRLAGREILVLSESVAAAATTGPQATLRLPPKTVYAERVAAASSSPSIDPLRFRFVLPSGGEVDVEPSFRVLEAIRFDPGTDRFRGRLGLGVLSRVRPQDTSGIDPPVRFTVSGPGLSLAPVQIPIRHLNQPFQEIEVSYSEPRDAIELQLVSSFDPQAPLRRSVATERPRLELWTSRPAADGFGLGTIGISVAAAGGPSFAGRRISLTTTGGHLDAREVTLDDQGRAETTLRTSFVGRARIAARGYPFSAPKAVPVNFSWPLAFLGALLAGALVGAVARHLFTRERWTRAAGGVLAGIVGGILAALGVNVVAVAVQVPAGEAFAFVVSALSAYLGPALFDRLLGSGTAGGGAARAGTTEPTEAAGA